MKKTLLSIAIICLIVVGCFTTLVSCSDSNDDTTIMHNDEILSRYGDAFVDVASAAAPSSAKEYQHLPRITRKFLIDTRITGRHVLGLYMPLNEPVTFTIDSSEIGKHHKIAINANFPLEDPYSLELDAVEITRTRQLMGGMIELNLGETNIQTFTLTISGCVELPSYRYGIDTGATFADVGNYNILDCMNARIYVPSSEYSKINKAEKVMNWWRNALLLMDQVTKLSIFNDDYSPMCIYFKRGVNSTEMFDSSNDCIYLPYDYIQTIVDYDCLTNGDDGKLFDVLDFIAREKLLITNAFSGTFLEDAIDDILAELTYINMVDSFSADLLNVKPECTAYGNIAQILEGDFSNNTDRYLALFTHLYYAFPVEVMTQALELVDSEKLSDALLIARIADITQSNLKPLADKLGISLYGGDIDRMQAYPMHYLVANKYTIGLREHKEQLGVTVKIGQNTTFDFASAIVGDGDWQISEVKGSANRWSKNEQGQYVYTPSAELLRDYFTLILTNGEVKVELYGNINVDIAVSSCIIYDNVSFKTLDEAKKGSKNITSTEAKALDFAGIEKEDTESTDIRYVVSVGAIEVDKTGDYTLYLKSSGLCSVNFGVKDYFTEIFNNQLTVSAYTDELSYTVKLEKGFTYIYSIYDLFNRGTGFASLGIKAPGKEIQDIDKSYLVYSELKRANIVEYTNEQKHSTLFGMQKEEYMPIKTSDIAQFSNIPSYKIGEVSDPIEKDSIVSFVLPFEEMSLVDYLMIQSQDMTNVTVKLYGGVNYSQVLAEGTILDKQTKFLFEQRNLDSIKIEFKAPMEYRLNIKELNVGKSISSMTIIPSTSTTIEYIGEWQSSTNYIAINGRLAITKSDDAIFSYSFNGNEISVYATIGPEFGIAKVTIDGQEKESIDLNNTKVLCSQLVYTAKLSDGDHIIQIIPADATPINIDYLAVTSFGKTETKNDFSKLWYIAIIPGLVLIAGIVFAVLDYREKKKKQAQP